MGSKPSNAFQMNRPESGGAKHNERLEETGVLEEEKRELTTAKKEARDVPGSPGVEPAGDRGQPEPEGGPESPAR